jgi:putative inorganic carbon (HCO3(-)) transporter
MDYVAFLIVNAILFVRPSEIVPELQRVPIYYFAMLACLAFSVAPLIKLFFYSPLIKHPTALFAFLLLFFAGASLLVTQSFDTALEEEIEFVKVIAYFVLFLAIVRTPQRLHGVIACVVLCMTVTASLGVLHYYEIINIPTLKTIEEFLDKPQSGAEIVRRLRFTGILHDPNEVGVFLSMLTFLSGFLFTNKQAGVARLFWLLPMGVFLFCVSLTASRGALLSLLTGMAAFAIYGFPSRDGLSRVPIKGLVFLGVTVPVLLLALGGRQTDISTSASTAQTRFGLWSDWLQDFRGNPVFGVGPTIASSAGAPDSFSKLGDWGGKQCAHNSYLQSFADLGFFGGLCFLGAMGFALITVHRYGFNKTMIFDADLARLQPYLMAALACCAIAFLTLTLNYVLPTFFVLALPVAYYGMTPCYPPIRRPSLTVDAAARLALAGVGFLAFTYMMVRIMPKQ